MLGPTILAQTINKATRRGRSVDEWQYHSRSDSHSKVACWGVLFDLLRECDEFRRDAQYGRIGFRVNHVIAGRLKKTLDLIVCRVPSTRTEAAGSRSKRRHAFRDLVDKYQIVVQPEQQVMLDALPNVIEEDRDDVSEVLVALEAKACMTEHVKALPRLFSEIVGTGFLTKQGEPNCISVCYVVVNSADTFRTPSNKKTNQHNQPSDATTVVRMIHDAIPRASDVPAWGYDAIGVSVLECHNDGRQVSVVTTSPPAPDFTDHQLYDRMIRSICSAYRARAG